MADRQDTSKEMARRIRLLHRSSSYDNSADRANILRFFSNNAEAIATALERGAAAERALERAVSTNHFADESGNGKPQYSYYCHGLFYEGPTPLDAYLASPDAKDPHNA